MPAPTLTALHSTVTANQLLHSGCQQDRDNLKHRAAASVTPPTPFSQAQQYCSRLREVCRTDGKGREEH
eukprot:2304479-Rhodomonas_salina.1